MGRLLCFVMIIFGISAGKLNNAPKMPVLKARLAFLPISDYY
jgi:hypothetical protein